MGIQIQVLSVQTETAQGAKGPYEVVEVAYKNLSFQGKVESKKIMPFGVQTNTAVTMKGAKPGDVFDIEVKKNDKGYNDWTSAARGSAQTGAKPTPATSATSTPSKAGGWETQEERAKKQIYIIRQSSLSTAAQVLAVGRKTEIKPEEVIELAKQFESFVFSTGDTQAVTSLDIESIPEDIPF